MRRRDFVFITLGIMTFDWIKFLDKHSIEYVDRGPNVARGNINIKCVYCGDDPSHHLGISLRGKGWGCWRNQKHRGKSPVRLVRMLLSCSIEHARSLVYGTRSDPEGDLSFKVKGLLEANKEKSSSNQQLSMPQEFKEFRKSRPSARPYFSYMLHRGYTEKDCCRLSEKYGLRYAVQGLFGGRIIFPVYEDGILQTWQGRAISPNEFLRYKVLTADVEKAADQDLMPALRSITDCVLWYDQLSSDPGQILFLVEGPFDALRLEYLGYDQGVRATCLFTRTISYRKEELLHKLAPLYRYRFVLLDREAWADGMAIQSRLSSLNFLSLFLPTGVKDPAEFSSRQFANFLLDHVR